jgi:hypothetical protein
MMLPFAGRNLLRTRRSARFITILGGATRSDAATADVRVSFTCIGSYSDRMRDPAALVHSLSEVS